MVNNALFTPISSDILQQVTDDSTALEVNNNTSDNIKDTAIFFSPFAITIHETFKDGNEVIAYLKEQLDDKQAQQALQQYINQLVDVDKFRHVLKGIKRDTSIGGSEVINPYPQVHEDDDIVAPINRIGGRYDLGMGRDYYESIYSRQAVMYLTFGTPQFSNLKEFFLNNIDSQLAKLMNTGEFSTITKISRLVGTIIGTVIALPLLPIKWFSDLFSAWKSPVTKFYDFKAAMPLYYRIVNSILAHLAVNMGITQISENITQQQLLDPDQGGSINIGTGGYQPLESSEQQQSQSGVSVSDIINDFGLDVLRILSKKDIYDDLVSKDSIKYLDDYIEELKNYDFKGPKGVWSRFVSGFKEQVTWSMNFIGVRIEKSVDSSESLSNQTAEPEIAQMVNSKIASARNKMINMAYGNITGTRVEEGIRTMLGAVKEVLTGALSSVTTVFGISDPAGALATFMGTGYFDFPEVYQSSTFNKSYNFTMKLMSVYGNPLSIFYMYFPLAFIMAGAFPRAIGKTAYTSPFILRAYARGKYAIPLGIIDSMTITRGSDEFGWSYDHLPLSINVTFSIKDLSPIMYVALHSDWFRSIFGNNTPFQEYMLTLSGVGLADRILYMERLKRRFKTSMKILMNNYLNPTMIGYTIGNMELFQMIAGMNPNVKLPRD